MRKDSNYSSYTNYVKRCKEYQVKPLPIIAQADSPILSQEEVELHKFLIYGDQRPRETKFGNSLIFMLLGFFVNIFATMICALTKPSRN